MLHDEARLREWHGPGSSAAQLVVNGAGERGAALCEREAELLELRGVEPRYVYVARRHASRFVRFSCHIVQALGKPRLTYLSQ